ncbi:MAG: glycosyltransferase [Planctomycetes bacterium]|nr:glycosyltransferase [Planctomycetota bacterium]
MDVATIVGSAALATSVALGVPAAVYAAQCLLGCLPARRRPADGGGAGRVAVVVPAHDEERGIGATVVGLLSQLRAGDRLVVVADNCGDSTADAARRAAAATSSAAVVSVLERRDDARRGKGYALAHAVASLAIDPPDAVVFVDADCRVAAGSVRDVAAVALATGRPAQADYVLRAPADGSALARIGAFAVVVRNRVRPRGMDRIGLPCHITGSGFALPWSLAGAVRRLGGDIVEDLVLGLESALAGRAPVAVADVRVASELPRRDVDAATQRRRWEHGQFGTAWRYAPRLLLRGLALRPAAFALALDLMVPPLSMLALLMTGAVALGALAAAVGAGLAALAIAIAALGVVALATFAAWLAHGRDALPFATLLRAPVYIAWKLPLYLGLVRGRETRWQRTRRDGER